MLRGIAGCLVLALSAASAIAKDSSNILNPNSYVPDEFFASSRLVKQHSFSLRPDRTLIIPDSEEDWEQYWLGLIVLPLTLLTITSLWCFGICCTCCCTCTARNDKAWRFRGFVACMVLCFGSIIAWTFCFTFDDELNDGVNSMKASVANIQVIVVDWNDLFEEAKAEIGTLQVFVNNLNDECFQDDSEFTETIDRLVTANIGPAEDLIDLGLEAFPDIIDALDHVIDEPVDTSANACIISFGAIMVVLIVFFMAATSAQFLNPGKNTCLGLKKCLSRASCMTIFTFGLFFISIAILFGCVIEVLAQVGSDACVPNPDQMIQNIIAQVNDQPVLETRRGTGTGLCQPIPGTGPDVDVNVEVELLCFYQTCNGATVVSDALERLVNLIGESFPPPPTNSSETCVVAYDNLSVFINTTVLTLTEEFIHSFRCNALNPIYVEVVHESLCNGFIDSTVQAWKIFVSGSMLLCAALVLHRFFNLTKTKDFVFSGSGKGDGSLYGQAQTNHADFGDGDDYEGDNNVDYNGAVVIPTATVTGISSEAANSSTDEMNVKLDVDPVKPPTSPPSGSTNSASTLSPPALETPSQPSSPSQNEVASFASSTGSNSANQPQAESNRIILL